MAMLITKFNKLIANKFVWIGFTFLIVVAFVAWDMAVPEEDRDPAARQAAGHLFGEPVSPDEFRSAYVHTHMGLTLAMGQPLRMTEELDAELTRMAWKRLASLKHARQLGIRTSDREVVEAIRAFPDFHDQGQFNPDIYRAFLHQYLGQLGFGPTQFEEHVRQELVLQQLQRMVSESVLITPAEIQRAIHSFGDEFTVQYATIDEDVLGEGLEISEEEARAFYDKDPEAFTIPPKVRVKYVRFPIADFKDEVEITEDQALSYYDLNIDDFTEYEEQEPALYDEEESPPDDDDLFRVATTIPFEDVKEEIMDRLRRDAAALRAADVATDFVISLVPDRHGDAATFEEAAEEYGVIIEETEPFARGETPENVDAGIAFAQAAFDLRPHRDYYFSDAVEGAEHMYVLALDERFASYVPDYEEVQDQVHEAARADAVARAVEDLAETFRDTAQTELRAGQTFEEIADIFAIPVSEPVTFSATVGLDDRAYGDELLRAVLVYNEGEVTEPVEIENRHLVAHVAQRTAADMDQYADFRQQIVSTLTGERARILFEQWQEQLLEKAEFTPREIPDPAPADEDDFYEDDWVMLDRHD